MSRQFSPKSVERSRLIEWVRQGIKLARFNIGWFAAALALYLFASFLTNLYADSFMVFTGVFLGLGILISHAHVEGIPTIDLLKSKKPVIWRRLLIVSVVPFILMIILIKLFESADFAFSDPTLYTTAPSIKNMPFHIQHLAPPCYSLSLYMLSIGYTFWSIIPLIVVDELPLGRAWSLAYDSCSTTNSFLTYTALFLGAILFFTAPLLPTFIVFLYPVLCGAIYIAHRDIFYNDECDVQATRRAQNPITDRFVHNE